MNKYETFALSQVFHSYPENKTFDEICELCKNDKARDGFNESLENTENEDQQLIACARYESEWWENIPLILKELAENSKYHIPDKIEDEKFNSFELSLLTQLLDKHIRENNGSPYESKRLKLLNKIQKLYINLIYTKRKQRKISHEITKA